MRDTTAAGSAAKAVVIVIVLLVILMPFAMVVLRSIATTDARMIAGIIPAKASLEAYVTILSGGVVTHALLVSTGVTIVGTALAVTLTVTMAYGLTRTQDVPGSKAILYIALFTLFFSAGIIPNYLLVKNLGLINSYWSLILPGMISAFNMVVVRNFFMQIPKELLEAARVDGAGTFRIFWSLVLPLSRAIIAVIALFYAVGLWNSFFTAILYLNDNGKWPIQLVLNQYVIQGSPLDQIQNPDVTVPPPQSVQMAIVVLATIPILIVYPFVQRHFTKGVLTGAIKG